MVIYMKKFKTIIEQKEYLIENKNIKNEDIIMKILSERPYASIINPYKKFFYTSVDATSHNYEDEISIVDYYKLATYDDLIAKEMNYKIGIFERRVKGAFAYVISSKMKDLGDDTSTSYINIFSDAEVNLDKFKSLGFNDYKETYDKQKKELVNVSDKTKTYRIELLRSISDINDDKKKRNRLFKKYIENSKPIPFWLVVHTLSLGDLLSIYQMLGKELRNGILKYLNDSIDENINKDSIFKFESDLNMIKELRNVVNHYEPLFEFIRNNNNIKMKHAINRIMLFSNKTIEFDYEEIKSDFPVFKNDDQTSIINLYCEMVNKIKKRDE